MSSINSDEIISILKEEIENFDSVSKDSEVGTVVAVGDGIATIYGIDHAMYGEIVTFDTGLKGMVQDIQKNEIGVILFGRDTDIKEGTKVTRTGKKAGVPVGNKYVGRVVNALGAPVTLHQNIRCLKRCLLSFLGLAELICCHTRWRVQKSKIMMVQIDPFFYTFFKRSYICHSEFFKTFLPAPVIHQPD